MSKAECDAHSPKSELATAPKQSTQRGGSKKSAQLRLGDPNEQPRPTSSCLVVPVREANDEEKAEAFWARRYKAAYDCIMQNIVTLSPPEQEIDLSKHFEVSKELLGDYVTLDWRHRGHIKDKMRAITDYVEDQTRKRPLNIMMQAEPGSGKSHFIDCLARKLSSYHVEAVTFNMAAVEGVDDLARPLDALRNVKVRDTHPLLFLDEFDVIERNIGILLPLLWDGELQVGDRELNVGKAIIVLAGSEARIREVMKSAKGMRSHVPKDTGKLVDFLSRINGGLLSIPALDEVDIDYDRRADKVCIALSLLARRFTDKLVKVSWVLLSFISQTRFRYGVRSINHLIDMIPTPKGNAKESLSLSDIALDPYLSTAKSLEDSSLAYHILSERGPAAVTKIWRSLAKHDVPVRFRHLERTSPLHGLERLFGHHE